MVNVLTPLTKTRLSSFYKTAGIHQAEIGWESSSSGPLINFCWMPAQAPDGTLAAV
jgi:hypothetical protein